MVGAFDFSLDKICLEATVVSVIGDLCFATVSGRGPDGYSEALELLRERLERAGS